MESGRVLLFVGWISKIRTKFGNCCSVGTGSAVSLLLFLLQCF